MPWINLIVSIWLSIIAVISRDLNTGNKYVRDILLVSAVIGVLLESGQIQAGVHLKWAPALRFILLCTSLVYFYSIL